MPDLEDMTPGQILADASVAEFIKSLGLAIAEAQTALDRNSVNQIPEFVKPIESLGGKSLLDLGFSPAFYHYQHADLSCSLQLSLKVAKNLSVGLGLTGSYNSASTGANSGSTSASSTESGSSTAASERNAQLQVTSVSTGALTVGDKSFTLTGSDALTRIRGLQQALTADAAAGVPRALYTAPDDTFAISTDAPADRVITTNRTVAFVGAGWALGIIRIDTNADTTYRLNATTEVTTTAKADVAAYAEHVAAQFQAAGFDARTLGPGSPATRIHFPTGRHHIEEFTAEGSPRNVRAKRNLEALAGLSRAMGIKLKVQGRTDNQPYPGGAAASDASNRQLGDRRANEVRDALIGYGASADKVTVTASTGAADARAAGGPADQVAFRNAEVHYDPDFHHVVVTARTADQALEGVTPANLTPPPTTGNAWYFMVSPRALSLTGKKCTIDATDFPFRGAAASGAASGSAEAYAANLATDINANTGIDFTASADANVVTVYKKSSPFTLNLFTAESRQLNLSGTEGITVTRQFTRTTSSSSTENQTSNSTVAFGASLDVRYGRQFDTTVTGNSAITARLVSIPAPPQFLEAIRDYLKPDA